MDLKLKQAAEQRDRVYSVVTVKALDDETREFTGIATTPSTDRMGDMVEPLGGEYQLPIPLLWQHNRDLPVGIVMTAKPTKNGIEVRGKIPTVPGPAGLVARLEEAWQSLKAQLVRGLSIGFQPLEYSFMDNGGIHFTKWQWLELSLVTIPANAEANVLSVKSFYQNPSAMLGKKAAPVVRIGGFAGVAATEPQPKPGANDMKTIPEQIAAYKATKADKLETMTTLMTKSAEAGATLDAADSEQYDTLQGEVESIDKHLDRLKKMEAVVIEKAEPVTDRSKMQERGAPAIVKAIEDLQPGIEFARYVMCLGASQGNIPMAAAIAEKQFPKTKRIQTVLKAAVEAGTTTSAAWAGNLVEYNQFAGDFVEFLRPRTIVGRFGREGVPALRSIPFNVHIRGQDVGGTGYWVGQGAPKPVTKAGFTDTYLGWAKIAAISVLTQELMRFSNPSAEMLVRDELANAVIERLDTDFVDPTKAASANVSPASITNGVTQIAASGTGTADDIRVDIAEMMEPFINANMSIAAGVFIMSSMTALRLSLMRNALGQKEFPEMSLLGGTLEGLPVITSEYVNADSNGGFVYLVSASDIWLADDGMVTIDASREASLQMLDNPTNNSSSGTATTMVSMFQTNSVAIRAERYINWAKRRTAAVSVLAKVKWGE